MQTEDTKNEDVTEAKDEAVVEVVEEAAEAKLPPLASFADFMKLDIRIGTIESVDVVEGADKLLKLMVNIGEAEPRQIVSGIREFFADPQSLVGLQCPFIVNLEPRMIRGLESQGMIMAAGEGEVFALLAPSNPLTPGTKVR